MIDPVIRRKGIGGSEVGAILGYDEMRDPFAVWVEKTDPDPWPVEPNERMIIGKALEKGVLELYTHVTKREVIFCDDTRVHPDRPWMVYTPDGLVAGEKRGVDAKVVFWDQRSKWGEHWYQIPQRVQLQCAYYMAAMDYDFWDVAAFIGWGLPRVYTIERNAKLEKNMLDLVERWWCRHIRDGEQPPITGSAIASDWLQRHFSHHKRPDMRDATDEEVRLLLAYIDIRKRHRALGGEKKATEAALKQAVGTREGIRWEDGEFTWRKSKDGSTINWENIARGLANQFKDQLKPGDFETLVGLHTYPKPGSRRIRLATTLDEDGQDEAPQAA